MLKINNIDIYFKLYLDIQKQKNLYSTLVFAKETINNNFYSNLNINSNTFIINKVIIYYYKIMSIKAKIQNTIYFPKKNLKSLIKIFFGQILFFIL